jgi:hypothetical protein
MSLFIHLDNRRELDFDVLSGEGLNESVNDQELLTTKCCVDVNPLVAGQLYGALRITFCALEIKDRSRYCTV